ncbi:hypothetical protein GGR52DRAFT_583820 [Hypoxylon sp. FL1284]|nr:hypothetical protein GGR52DRAFT_583820 [Hypoxylon sp. FL1284]
MASPIAKLGPEVLLEVFEWLSLGGPAALVPAALCCKKWHPQALFVLYGDVVLDQRRLVRFADSCADREVRSLTLRLDAIRVDPYEPTGAQSEAELRLEALRCLCPRIAKMRPVAVSLSLNFPFPYPVARAVADLLDHLPACCVSLEVDVRYGSSVAPHLAADAHIHPHMCDAVRAVLPRLQHLRLRLPLICPAVFSAEPPGRDGSCQAVSAPTLKTCVVNLGLRPPGPYTSQGVWASPCGGDFEQTPHIGQLTRAPSAMPPLAPALTAFARLNAATLERLWVLDVEPRAAGRPHSWAAWVRRDFLADASAPIPLANIGGFRAQAWLARVPDPAGSPRDWISQPDVLEGLVEGGTWVEDASGARLPAAPRRRRDAREALARAPFQARQPISCMLWRNEDITGEALFPTGPGELMRRWDLEEITPSGWTRDDYTASYMVRS